MKKKELLKKKRLHRILTRIGKRHFRNQRFRNSDLPPKHEWGTVKDFETHCKNNAPRCQAFSKNKIFDGKRNAEAQCPRRCVVGYKYCSSHLKKSHWTYIDMAEPITVRGTLKKYEKYLPKHIISKVIEAANDPNKLSNEGEIDMVTARLMELFERLEGRESKTGWRQVIDARGMLKAAIKNGDPQTMRVALDILDRAIKQSDYLIWDDIIHMIQNRARLVSDENARILKTAEVVNITELMAIVAKTQQIIFEVVTDKQLQFAIAERMRAEILEPDPQLLPEGESAINVNKSSNRGKPKWAQTMKSGGCGVCNTPRFRERNYTDQDEYTCPSCGKLWNLSEDPDIFIVEGKAKHVRTD